MTIKKGGKKGKKGKKTKDNNEIERELVFKDIEQYQEYAQVTKLLGNCRCTVSCIDGAEKLAHIRGNMTKKQWIKSGDIVLVSIREFEQSKCDIIYLYNLKEARKLKNLGELPSNIKINENLDLLEKEDEEDIGIDILEEEEVNEEEVKKENFAKDFEENFKFI
jgi:translation initiation factor 1A